MTARLRELEKRLDHEPTNIALRVQVAGLLREAGRSAEAVEQYRAVAVAYRDGGRPQQAIAVCRSILDIAPGDAACRDLLATLESPASPAPAPATAARPSRDSFEATPLPGAMPYHVIDPTSQRYKLSVRELDLPLPPERTTPGTAIPSTTIDLAAEVETRQRPRVSADQLARLEEVTDPDADLMTEPRDALPARVSDDELTLPVERRRLFDDD